MDHRITLIGATIKMLCPVLPMQLRSNKYAAYHFDHQLTGHVSSGND
jgi:hypothetical protein